MHKNFKDVILQETGATSFELIEVIQELWSGYGTIRRYRLTGSRFAHVVIKHVHYPDQSLHPRGWNTNLSHQRKLRSYQIETNWYSHWSKRCDTACKVPSCLAVEQRGDETLMVLEDLNESGFPIRHDTVGTKEMTVCLQWLANFHATFLGCQPERLWEQGTYWHLATRPDELAALTDIQLQQAAPTIDAILKASPYQTIVHGDAKLANFCFSPSGNEVAAVDFQYVGGGCGMKDVAYFIGSCLGEDDCARRETQLLDCYFIALKKALQQRQPGIDSDAVETDWRQLFPLAWTDFHRFLKGWSPGHWKLNAYSERLARAVINQLSQPEQRRADAC